MVVRGSCHVAPRRRRATHHSCRRPWSLRGTAGQVRRRLRRIRCCYVCPSPCPSRHGSPRHPAMVLALTASPRTPAGPMAGVDDDLRQTMSPSARPTSAEDHAEVAWFSCGMWQPQSDVGSASAPVETVLAVGLARRRWLFLGGECCAGSASAGGFRGGLFFPLQARGLV
jgi:hypothetical protein